MAGALTRTAMNKFRGATAKALSNKKGYSSNVPRYRDDPIGSTGQSVVEDTSNTTGSTKTNDGITVTATPTQDSSAMLIAYMKEMEARQKKAANDAYDRNVSSMNDAFKQRGDLLKNNLNSTLQNLQTDYDASKANVNKDAQNSLQQAYINNMLSRKNLNQNMAAQGLSGGASETTMAGMYNNYGNARNSIQTVVNENLGNLENLYNQNRNSAYQSYNDQMAQDAIAKAQYMAQFEADRQNALANAYNQQLSQLMNLDPSYITGMTGLVDSQQGYTYTGTSADNTPDAVNTQQGSNTGATSGIMGSYYGRLARSLRGSGKSDPEIAQELANEGIANSTILYILNQLQ